MGGGLKSNIGSGSPGRARTVALYLPNNFIKYEKINPDLSKGAFRRRQNYALSGWEGKHDEFFRTYFPNWEQRVYADRYFRSFQAHSFGARSLTLFSFGGQILNSDRCFEFLAFRLWIRTWKLLMKIK